MGSGLVARNNELRRARALLEDKGVAVLIGPSGVGKTAICDVLAGEWGKRGDRVVDLRGTHGLRKVPFGALTLALRVDPGESEKETLSRAVSFLTGNGGRPLVVVDDVHNLDDESAGVVVGLAQSSGIALLMAVTSGETVSVDITSVWARWPGCRLDVAPLDRVGVAELLTELVPDLVEETLVSDVLDISLGYPLYVVTIANELQSSMGVNSIKALESGSDRLTSLMERRLSRLDREGRRLFDVVAFAEATSSRIVVGDGDPLTLDRLRSDGLVRIADERVQVAHPLLASVARGTLTLEGQRACARHLLENLNGESEPVDVATVVRKAVAVGLKPAEPSLRIATEVALSWGDYEGAARLSSIAHDSPELKVLGARASRFLGEVPPTEIPVGLDDAGLTEFLSATSQALAYAERRFTDAIEFLQAGMAGVVEVENRNRLALELMVLSGLVGDIDTLLGASRAAAITADPATKLLAISATQLAEALTLTTVSSDDTYRQGIQVAAAAGEFGGMLVEQLEMSHVGVELAEGRFRSARSLLASFEPKSLLGSWLTVESVMADAWGSVTEAVELAESAVTALHDFDPLANLAQARIVAALRRAQRGDAGPDEDPGPEHEAGVAAIDRVMGQRVDAWVAWSDEDPSAGKQLAEVGREAIALGHRFWGLCALIDAVRLGLGDDVVSDIEHLVITRGAGLAKLASRHARAVVGADYWSVAEEWWQAGATTYAVEAAIFASESDVPLPSLGTHVMARLGAIPLVVDVNDVECPVTDRQLDVIVGVVSGESNDQIAERLYLSRRTVENHLHRIYATLGMKDGRDGLLSALGWISPD